MRKRTRHPRAHKAPPLYRPVSRNGDAFGYNERGENILGYDADGNMTDDGEFAYSYDVENRLISVVPLSMTANSAC